jgi:hypothetical protein
MNEVTMITQSIAMRKRACDDCLMDTLNHYFHLRFFVVENTGLVTVLQ